MSEIFGYQKVHCPICKGEMDGMKGYGRESHCCDKECHDEWEWRRTLAIMKKPYTPRNGSRWDTETDAADFALQRIRELEGRP